MRVGAQRVWSQAPTPGPPGQQLHRVEVAPSSWGRWGVGAQHGSMPGAVMAAFPWWSLLPPLPVACAHLGVSTKPQGGEGADRLGAAQKGREASPRDRCEMDPKPEAKPSCLGTTSHPPTQALHPAGSPVPVSLWGTAGQRCCLGDRVQGWAEGTLWVGGWS